MADPKEGRVRPAAPPGRPSPEDTATEDASGGATIESRIGVYRVEGLLGSGGMGDVFLAWDERLRRRVAIKRIRSDAAVTARSRERLRREAAASAALNHPALVHVYDILSDESGEAIVMEYVEGETLAEARARGPLPPAQAVRIGRQVAEGLAAAHAAGLIHRDLKTQNVMVTASGRVKVLDFGLAKSLRPMPGDDTLTSEGALVGTVRSMSPEQARGLDLDARSDLFSLGVLLYEICTGRPPFHGESPTETLLKLVADPPAPIEQANPDVPPPLARLVGELLEKDPQRRPASAADVAARLAEMETADPLPRAPLPRARRARLAGALALLAALGGLALWTLARRAPPARPVAVLVAEPALRTSDERSRLAAFAVREGVVRALTQLGGVEPVGSEEVSADALTPLQAARAVAAEEIVIPAMDCTAGSCRVSLRRLRAGDGHVLETSKPLDVSSEPEDALALDSAVALTARSLFADHAPRPGRAETAVRAADFERYLAIRRRASAGAVLAMADVQELETLAQGSPGLAEARLLAAAAARAQKDRATALRILQEASAADPQDPRFANERFLLELETSNLAEAARALASLESLVPGDLRVSRGRARLLVAQGRQQEAVELYQRLLRERPSWRNLWSVANLEIDLGDEQGAREHLRRLLEMSPRNPRGRAKLAELEWTLGDPAQAVRIYEELRDEQTQRQEPVTRENVSNLGWSRLLARDYAGAVAAYREALALRPEDLRSRLNLGIAHAGLGDSTTAREVFRDLLARAAPRAEAGTLTPSERLLQAQAMARLGDSVRAVEITLQATGEGARSPQELFQAALIYALCGDTNHALVLAQQSRPRLSRSWFGVPGFESVRGEPAFRTLTSP